MLHCTYIRYTFICTKHIDLGATRIEREETGVYMLTQKEKKNSRAKRRVVGSEKCNNKMRAAQKEALAIVRKTYGSIPGRVLQ